MGLGNNTTATYVDMRNGKIYRYSKTNEMGTTPIQNKNGDIKYYFIYDFIEGTVTNFSTREEEVVGKTKLILQIHLVDQGENYVLKIDTNSSYFRMFCSVLPNIDFNYPVRFIPRIKEENGVKKSSLIVVNNNTPCKFFFTKDNPNGKPDIIISKNKKGDIVDIDRDEELEFFMNLLTQTKKRLPHPAMAQDSKQDVKPDAFDMTAGAAIASISTDVVTEEEDNDLPW
jgi:hypothetical protein